DQVVVIDPGRAQPSVGLGVLVPLEAALEVLRGAAVLLVGLALIEIAELVRDPANLVALGILREDLLKEQLGAALVVNVVGAPAVIFELHGPLVNLVGGRNILIGLESRRRHVEVEPIGLLGNAVIL